MRRRMIAALPIVIVATLLAGEGSASALPVKKNQVYTGPIIALSAKRGIPTSSAATNFTVPNLTCSTSTSATTGITFGSGIYSAASNWVSAGGVVAECQGGVPVYSAQVIIDNDVSVLPVTPNAGDAISTTVDIVPGQTQVTVDDITQNGSTTITVPVGSIGTSLLLGADIDRNPSVTGVPNFGKVKFTNASFNQRAASKAKGVKIDDLYSGTELEVTSSQLVHKGVGGFTLTFVNSGGSGT
jgi:hypothetical protein